MKKSIVAALICAFSLGSAMAAEKAITPAAYSKDFRFSIEKMHEIANSDRLAWRVFYDKPSEGKDAKWFDAVKKGNLALVKQMVEKGQNLEAKDEASLGQTALGWAAFIGYKDIVDYLISEGASLYATDSGDVYNVLKSAVLGGDIRIVKQIWGNLAPTWNVNNIEDDGETLLMVAASNDRREVVEFLLSKGADINIKTTTQDKSLFSYNQSALSYACDRNLPEMQKLLIKHGAINHRTGKANCEVK